MAEPTSTRKTLRRALCLELQMPFYLKYNDEKAVDSATASTITDTDLKQKQHYWRQSWYYQVDGDEAGEYRQIRGFDEDTKKLYLEYDLSGTPAAGELYELLSIWSPRQVHKAINDAIREGFPAFFEIDMDESLCLVEDRMEYDISDISNLYKVLKIWIENPTDTSTGTVVSTTGTVTTLESDKDLSDVDTNWYISTYDGTGKGQIRAITAVDDTAKTVTHTAWTTNADSTTKYRIWDPTVQAREWTEISAVKFDRKHWPEYLYLVSDYSARAGCRLRIQYMKQPTALTSDTSTTVVPEEYIILKAKSRLFSQRQGDTRAKRDYQSTAISANEEAENYKGINAFPLPDQTLWQETDDRVSGGGEQVNPLGW